MTQRATGPYAIKLNLLPFVLQGSNVEAGRGAMEARLARGDRMY